MSTPIEDLIVALGFDNKQFEAAVKVSLATISSLKNNLNFKGAGADFAKVESAASENASALGIMGQAAEGVGQKFSIMGAIGFTAVQRMTNKVIDFGSSIASGALSGGLSRALKIEQARFQFQGLGQDVDASMQSALDAVKGTAYGLDAAASVASQFGATGMTAGDEMTGALRGVAGMAAMTGKSFEEIGGIFTTIAGEGKLTTMRMQQFATRGVNVAAKLSEVMGKSEADVRAMVTAGKIDFKTFADAMNEAFGEHATKASDTYSGSLDNMNAALSRIGASFHVPRLEAMRKIFNAITPVIDQIADGLKPLVRDFTAFTEINGDALVGWIEKIDLSKMADVVGPLSRGMFNLFEIAIRVFKLFKTAFTETFQSPALKDMAIAFQLFTLSIKDGGETADKLKRTFKGLFAIFGIGVEIIKGVFNGLGKLFGVVRTGSGGFLSLTATIGDWLVKLHEAIKSGEVFQKIFGLLGNVLSIPIRLLTGFIGILANIGSAFQNVGRYASEFIRIFTQDDYWGLGSLDADHPVINMLYKMKDAFKATGAIVSQFWNILAKGDFVGGFFEEDSGVVTWLLSIRESIVNFFSPANFTKMLMAGGGAGLGLVVAKFLKKIFSFGKDDDEGMFATIKGMFSNISGAFEGIKGTFSGIAGILDGLTESLKVMQQNVKATIILKIAAAVGILALAIKVLSTIDGPALAMSLGALTGAFTLLMGAMAILTLIAKSDGFLKLPTIATAMISFSIAALILSFAVKKLAELEWDELLRGLTGLAAVFAVLVASSYLLGKAEGPMLRTGLAMIPLALGVLLLTKSVRALADMQWDELLRGVGSLAALMTALAISVRLMPKDMMSKGAGLILIAAGMLLMSKAINALGNTDIETLRQGILGIGSALAIIGVALQLFPKNMIRISTGLLVVSAALMGISAVVQSMGGMSWEELGRGLAGLGGSLAILALALNLMSGTVSGAAALLVAAFALGMLIPPLMLMSALSWESLLKGLAGLAGIFLVLGVAGMLMGPVIPVLLGLGAAMALMGVGAALLGAGTLAFAAGMALLIPVINMGKEALIGFMDLIPRMAAAFATGVVMFVVTIANNAKTLANAVKDLVVAMLEAFTEIIPKVVEVFSTLLTALLEMIIEHIPQFGELITTLITTFLDIVTTNAPRIWDAGYALIIGFLERIRDNVPQIVTIVTDIIVGFINALAQNLPRVIQAGFDFIITFLNGLADAIRENMPLVFDAAINVGDAIIDGLIEGISRGIEAVKDAAKRIAKGALDSALSFLGIRSPSREFIKVGEFIGDGLVIGIEKGIPKVKKAAEKLATGVVAGFSKGMGTQMPKMLDSVLKTLEEGVGDAHFWGPGSPATDQLLAMSADIHAAELQLAAFYGEVDLADPASIEAYAEKAGGKLKYLAGAFEGVRVAAGTAFGMLAKGDGLDAVLGNEDFLSQLLGIGLSFLPGIEGMGIRLGLALVDGILGVFVGEGTTVLGTIGGWITKLVRKVGSWFGIEFPKAKEEVEEGSQAIDDFLVKVEGGHGRFQKLTKEGIAVLVDAMTGVNEALDKIEDTSPKITPVLELDQFEKDIGKMNHEMANTAGKMSVDASAAKASSIYNAQQASAEDRSTDNPAGSGGTTIEFTQYNNSPKALNHVEIYRSTKSQLSLAKEELNLT